jgi:hypothetical protein
MLDKMDANRAEMNAMMNANQEEMRTALDEWLMNLNDGRK